MGVGRCVLGVLRDGGCPSSGGLRDVSLAPQNCHKFHQFHPVSSPVSPPPLLCPSRALASALPASSCLKSCPALAGRRLVVRLPEKWWDRRDGRVRSCVVDARVL